MKGQELNSWYLPIKGSKVELLVPIKGSKVELLVVLHVSGQRLNCWPL